MSFWWTGVMLEEQWMAWRPSTSIQRPWNYTESITDTNSQLRLQITMNDSLPKISILYLKETFQMITNEPLMNQCHAKREMDGLQASRDPDLSRINYGHKLPITATVSNIVRWIGVLGTPHTIIALCSGGRTLFVRGLSRWCHLVIEEPRKTWLGVIRSDPETLEQSRIN